MNYKTFKDIVFEKHKASIPEELIDKMKESIPEDSDVFAPMFQSMTKFDNGHYISVIFGKMFYSNGLDTYEAMASEDNEPRGYLTIDELNEFMKEVQDREQREISTTVQKKDLPGSIHRGTRDAGSKPETDLEA